MTTERPVTAPHLHALAADDPHEVGGYRVVARLGAGGMGRVYLCYTPGGRPVALKVVRPELAGDPEFRLRFAQEVASAQRIHGLYTAQVVDSGVDAALPWLATTYVPGPSLQQAVNRYGPLPLRTVLLLVAGIAEALQEIHRAGVVHRDLKPANVLIAADGPRVIDFGIARAAHASRLTSTGLRIGSPAFMAPEQALGRAATPATDVFALGALAVYVAGGAPPFGEGPESSSLYRVVHEEADLTRVPVELQELLRHCLAKTPEHRPTTAQVIEAVRRHPAVGGQLRFADDWLPQQVSSEILRHADLPVAPATAPPGPPPATALLTAFESAHTMAAPGAPHPQSQPSPPAPSRGRRREASGRRTGILVVAAVVAALLAGAAGAFVLLDGDPDPGAGDEGFADAAGPVPTPSATPSPTPTPTPASVPGYTGVYAGTELTSPDQSYEFDLKGGRVAPQDSVSWYVGRTATEFYVPENSDAYILPGGRSGLADCLKGIESQPVTALPFTTLKAGRSFCVRAQDSRDVGILTVITTGSGEGPVKVSVDYYHRNG
ncbi:serine/threonine-protein kinase [Streptomyces sp. NBC_00503]|uniref:serine/threonine-protein kinase n=1 Tax=Streptomyces sp. NBC_00503 TaxID=2903659 RepID=UPI002E81DFC9|nr:serine/threonine-protein kinase [Streptomyces sp. NBC_00503]WUD79502.1 serine/threonine protein kinase [Streptomyces sp. NBC_00503]